MKKTLLFATVLLSAIVGYGQQSKVAVKKEVKKEVKLESVSGEKTLTIETEEGGITKTQVFRGDQVDDKLKEMEAFVAGVNEMQETIEIKLEEIDGNNKLTISRTTANETTEEIFLGDEADKKLEELGLGEKEKTEKVQTKEIRILKTVKE